ncbi:MAG: DNA-protecting protein DprA [Candidatus Kerfeldbacteria bacterium]|nr:DNA-protecting protein DprA [Candidatus Kerfeldbacteria bacterium]
MDTVQKDIIFWVGFSHCRSIGARTLKRLIDYFPDLEAAWRAPAEALLRAGVAPHRLGQLLDERKRINPEAVYQLTLHHQINIVTIKNQAYPPLLREIPDAPQLLFYRGSLPRWTHHLVAVVGSRKTTPYGRHITPLLIEPLAAQGITVVSGLALGIDTLAHQSTLDMGGTTIAVLAGGLDTIYPRTNTALAESIIAHGGCLLSEYPVGTPPFKQHFPIRNRIIAGLSHLTVVIEGMADSGSLITARLAVDYNRDVGAVPGAITSDHARGPHHLLKDGAAMIERVDDIYALLKLDKKSDTVQNKSVVPTTDAERQLLELIGSIPVDIDEIFQQSRLPSSAVNTALTNLEMNGTIRRSGSTHYVRT